MYQHIAGYKFISLEHLECLQTTLQKHCEQLNILGTILLSNEGININVAGLMEDIESFKTIISQFEDLSAIFFNTTYASIKPYKKLKVKIKKEIITFKDSSINPIQKKAKTISPIDLKGWLDAGLNFTLLDTRNAFEIATGTFENAIDLNIDHFTQFNERFSTLSDSKTKPIVMFCTGGIRCEKAALAMEQKGFNNVYQLEGGILNYFNTVGREYFIGKCFVFDERIAI